MKRKNRQKRQFWYEIDVSEIPNGAYGPYTVDNGYAHYVHFIRGRRYEGSTSALRFYTNRQAQRACRHFPIGTAYERWRRLGKKNPGMCNVKEFERMW